MGILDRLLPNRKEEKKADDIVEKLIKLIDLDSFFWDKPQKVTDFFQRELKQHILNENKKLFPILKGALPKKHYALVGAYEEEHGEIIEKCEWLEGMLKNDARLPSKNLKIEIVKLSGELIEQIVSHTRREEEELYPLARKYLKPKNYKELQNALEPR
jgi:iron-sulfur cluster repair protein YtfE (RIC family)